MVECLDASLNIEQGVTINTVGVTNDIHEDVLEEIANVTGGGYYFAEDLPDAFDRVQQDRVELADSDDDGIPDAVADANPQIPQLPPISSPGAREIDPRININPAIEDTSGVGIPDAEAIDVAYDIFTENNKTKLRTRVTSAEHHPALVDTDGDGVSDKTEVSETEIRISTGARQSRAYLNALTNRSNPTPEEVEAVREEHLERREVTSSAFLTHTHRTSREVFQRYLGVDSTAQLNDSEKYALGLDPAVSDTTEDGIPDAVAIAKGYDPTLYDYRKPEIQIRNTGVEGPEFGRIIIPNEYVVDATISDLSGITHWNITIDGETEAERDDEYGPYPLEEIWESVDADNINQIGDVASATRIEVTATDRNGNSLTRPALTMSGVAGAAARQLERDDWVRDAGRAQGLHSGGAGTVGGIVDLIFNAPEKLRAIDSIQDLIPPIHKFPEAVRQQQRVNNPYIETVNDEATCGDADSDEQGDCEQFRDGWYEGYTTWFVVEAVVGTKGASKAGSALDKLEDVSPSAVTRVISGARTTYGLKDRALGAGFNHLARGFKRTTALGA